MTIQDENIKNSEVKRKRLRLRDMPKNTRYPLYTLITIITFGMGYIAYLAGNINLDFKLNSKPRREISNLRDEKSVLINKINEYHRIIPLMKEEFAQQYQDSLAEAVQDTSAINTKIRNLEAEIAKNKDKVNSSWSYYFFN